jgi:hypothetical protein
MTATKYPRGINAAKYNFFSIDAPNVSMRIAVIIVKPSNVEPHSNIDEFGQKRKQNDGLVVSKGTEKHSNERI